MPRGEALKATRQRKLDEAFAGRAFEVVAEVNLPPGQVFQTPFGNKGRHGYIIRDRETGDRMVVGKQVLRILHDQYQAVALPQKRRQPTGTG